MKFYENHRKKPRNYIIINKVYLKREHAPVNIRLNLKTNCDQNKKKGCMFMRKKKLWKQIAVWSLTAAVVFTSVPSSVINRWRKPHSLLWG